MYQHLADCTEFEVHYVKIYALPDVDTVASRYLHLQTTPITGVSQFLCRQYTPGYKVFCHSVNQCTYKTATMYIIF